MTNLASIFSSLQPKMKNLISGKHPYVSDLDAANYIKKNFPSYQYTGIGQFEEVLEWCESNLGNDWVWNMETFYFKTEHDKLFFMLRWS